MNDPATATATAAAAAAAEATPLQRLFTGLLERDPGGRSWFGRLLRAAPHADRLGELADEPGYLHVSITVRGISGRLACFDYIAGPSRELLEWYIAHADRLTWPAGVELTPEVRLLRRALIEDVPPGARVRAQARARELMDVRSALAREWWRFEEVRRIDCLLMTERLVVTVLGESDPLAPVTPWYPPRPELVRALEAARSVADGERSWTSLVVSERADQVDHDAALRACIDDAAPHLGPRERAEITGAFLGALTLEQARGAVS
jgi:hypothetical protein